MHNNSRTTRRLGTRQIAVVGMLSAVSIILGASGYGFIPLPTIKLTIMHIPVIIGAIVEGPLVGAMIGLIFGLFSIFQNITAPALLSFALINPLVSVLPRILIGITSFYAYKLTPGKFEALKIGVGAAVGSLTNTIGVLGMIYLLYSSQYAQAKKIGIEAVLNTILTIAAGNGIPEAIGAVAITVPVVLALNRLIKNR